MHFHSLFRLEYRYILPLLFISILFVSSCSLEQRIALKYQKKIPQTSVLLRGNTDLFFTNSKVSIEKQISESRKKEVYDSAFENSSYIQYMDADYYLKQFDNNFSSSLRNIGLVVYNEDSITYFLNQAKPKIIIEIMQLEVEEYSKDFIDKTFEIIENNKKPKANIVPVEILDLNDDDTYLSVAIPINAVSVNAWISVTSIINDTVQYDDMLFLTYEISDEVDGFFDYDYIKEVPYYNYDINTLEVGDLWKTEVMPPTEFSKELVDYFANEYIGFQLMQKTKRPKSWYWQINPKTKRLLPTHSDFKYIVIDKETVK